MMKRALWIEDGALVEYQEMVAAAYAAAEFDLVTVHDASAGLSALMRSEFDAIVVDIRLPPGDRETFRTLYSQHSANPAAARLGLALIDSLFRIRADLLRSSEIPSWISPDRFAVLTVEEEQELEDHLAKVGITRLRTKEPGSQSDLLLLSLVRDILKDAT